MATTVKLNAYNLSPSFGVIRLMAVEHQSGTTSWTRFIPEWVLETCLRPEDAERISRFLGFLESRTFTVEEAYTPEEAYKIFIAEDAGNVITQGGDRCLMDT